jgi:restriction endonuclease S subunit
MRHGTGQRKASPRAFGPKTPRHSEIQGYQKVINGARSVLDHYRAHISIQPNWPIVELGEVCDLYQPKTITQQDLIEDGSYLVFGANGVIGRYNHYNHEDAEVLITCRGATCGTIHKSEPKSWVTGNAMVAKPKDARLTKEFLLSLLKGADLGSTISGSAQPQITRQGLAPFKISLPPRHPTTNRRRNRSRATPRRR